jgi:hypothetical protein
VGIGISYLRFVWQLPADTRWRFVFAGTAFVSAVLGLEVVESLYETSVAGDLDARYAAMCGTEEILKMCGVALFIDALLRHLFIHEGIRGLSIVEVSAGEAQQTTMLSARHRERRHRRTLASTLPTPVRRTARRRPDRLLAAP